LRDPEKAKKLQVGFLAMKKDGSPRGILYSERLYLCRTFGSEEKYMNQKAGLADGKKHT